MNLFERLFRRKKMRVKVKQNGELTAKPKYEIVPKYVSVPRDEVPLVALIASAIAAENKRKSQFMIKKVSQQNPEAQLVSIIAACMAAADNPQSQFKVRSIKRKLN